MAIELPGSRALIVGASRGIGRAIAVAYGDAGADVALAARSVDDLRETADRIETDTCVLPCDIRETDAVDATVERADDELGGLDVVVNSAGVLSRGAIAGVSDAEMEWVVDVNLQGAIRVARRAIPELERSQGALVHVTSIAAQVGVGDLGVYSATKGAIDSMTRQLAVQHADDGVRVNAIAPGTIKTSMNAEVRATDPDWERVREERVPLGRLGEPDDVAGLAVFLGSDAASYITGQVLAVDGGVLST